MGMNKNGIGEDVMEFNIVSTTMKLDKDIDKIDRMIEKEKYQEAIELFFNLYPEYVRTLGKGYIGTINLLQQYGVLLRYIDDYDKALEIFKEVYDLFCINLGEKEQMTLYALCDLSDSYRDIGDYQKML